MLYLDQERAKKYSKMKLTVWIQTVYFLSISQTVLPELNGEKMEWLHKKNFKVYLFIVWLIRLLTYPWSFSYSHAPWTGQISLNRKSYVSYLYRMWPWWFSCSSCGELLSAERPKQKPKRTVTFWIWPKLPPLPPVLRSATIYIHKQEVSSWPCS